MRAQSRAAKWISMSVLAGIVGFVGAVGSATAGPPGVSVVVRGRGDEALADVRVIRRNADGKWTTVGTTSASGEVTLPAEAVDESWIIAAWINGYEPGAGESPKGAKVKSARVELRLDCGTRMTTEVVDAQTGAAIPGAEWRLELWNAGFTPWTRSGGETPALLGPDGHAATLQIRLAPAVEASYYLDRDGAASPSGSQPYDALWTGSALARRVVVPVRRALTLRVDVRNSSGRKVRPEKADWFPGSRSTGPDAAYTAVDPDAKEVVLKLPFHRGADVWVVAQGDRMVGRRLVTMPSDVGVRLDPVKVTLAPLPPDDASPRGLLIGVGGRPRYAKTEPDGAVLRVTALRSDGTPAPGRTVRIRSDATVTEVVHEGLPPQEHPLNDFTFETDDEGLLGVRSLPLGAYTVTAEDDRYIAVTQRVELSEKGKPTRVELREPRGATVDVTVVDGSGKPLPFAEVQVTGPAGGHGDAGVEPRRIDPYTDLAGRRTFTRVDPGVIQVRAVWFSREVTATVEVPDGGRGAVTVTFEPPRAK